MPINPAPGRVERPLPLFTWVIPVWRVHVAGVGILHSGKPECEDGEVQQGPSTAGYNAGPLPRVTGEDLNGGLSGDNGCRYGQCSGRGELQRLVSGS